MEIVLISKDSLKIKGKAAVLTVDSVEKQESNACLLLSKGENEVKIDDQTIVINGPGEYEAGGIKIVGYKLESEKAYGINVDSLNLTLGNLSTLSKFQNKLKEANILIVNCDNVIDATFLTALATNVMVFYGENAGEVGKAIGAENAKKLPKYSVTLDKLPTEVETIILE